MRYSCLLGGKYKFTANASNKDHKITKIHHFLHSINIRVLHSTFEGSFECRTFVYALIYRDSILLEKSSPSY